MDIVQDPEQNQDAFASKKDTDEWLEVVMKVVSLGQAGAPQVPLQSPGVYLTYFMRYTSNLGVSGYEWAHGYLEDGSTD